MVSMIDILQVEDGIWVLQEDGLNVLLADCQKFGITKAERKGLLLFLREVVQALRQGENVQELVDRRVLKKLERQSKASEENLWEVRADSGSARILFMMMDPDAVIVSAVHKSRGSLRQAVNRGVNRWRNFLKTRGK